MEVNTLFDLFVEDVDAAQSYVENLSDDRRHAIIPDLVDETTVRQLQRDEEVPACHAIYDLAGKWPTISSRTSNPGLSLGIPRVRHTDRLLAKIRSNPTWETFPYCLSSLLRLTSTGKESLGQHILHRWSMIAACKPFFEARDDLAAISGGMRITAKHLTRYHMTVRRASKSSGLGASPCGHAQEKGQVGTNTPSEGFDTASNCTSPELIDSPDSSSVDDTIDFNSSEFCRHIRDLNLSKLDQSTPRRTAPEGSQRSVRSEYFDLEPSPTAKPSTIHPVLAGTSVLVPSSSTSNPPITSSVYSENFDSVVERLHCCLEQDRIASQTLEDEERTVAHRRDQLQEELDRFQNELRQAHRDIETRRGRVEASEQARFALQCIASTASAADQLRCQLDLAETSLQSHLTQLDDARNRWEDLCQKIAKYTTEISKISADLRCKRQAMDLLNRRYQDPSLLQLWHSIRSCLGITSESA